MRWAGHVAFVEEMEYAQANILIGRLEGKTDLRDEA
jgi:hypothetical protein